MRLTAGIIKGSKKTFKGDGYIRSLGCGHVFMGYQYYKTHQIEYFKCI